MSSDRCVCVCSQQLLEAEQAPPRPPSHTIDIIEGNEEEVEEDDFFPGTDFLSVVDVVQVSPSPSSVL